MSFETKLIAFFGANSRCFLPRSLSPAKAMRYADETYSKTARYGLRNNSNTLNKFQPGLYKHSDSLVLVLPCVAKRQRGSSLASIKSSFYARLLHRYQN